MHYLLTEGQVGAARPSFPIDRCQQGCLVDLSEVTDLVPESVIIAITFIFLFLEVGLMGVIVIHAHCLEALVVEQAARLVLWHGHPRYSIHARARRAHLVSLMVVNLHLAFEKLAHDPVSIAVAMYLGPRVELLAVLYLLNATWYSSIELVLMLDAFFVGRCRRPRRVLGNVLQFDDGILPNYILIARKILLHEFVDFSQLGEQQKLVLDDLAGGLLGLDRSWVYLLCLLLESLGEHLMLCVAVLLILLPHVNLLERELLAVFWFGLLFPCRHFTRSRLIQ